MIKRVFRIFAVLLVLILVSCNFSVANANGPRVVRTNKKTSTVIVGDSRIRNMYISGYKSFSTIASAGGRYSSSSGSTIHSKKYSNYQKKTARTEKKLSRYNTIMHSVDSSLRKHKKCRVVLVATINECHSKYSRKKNFPAKQAQALGKLAAKINARSIKLNKKSVKPTVYVMACQKSIDRGYGLNYKNSAVKRYNALLKRYATKYDYKFVIVRDPKKNEYKNDGLHYKMNKSGYNKYLWKKINSLPF